MSSTDSAQRFAGCTNVANCGKARADETVEWYRGAGEYCPECGEALTPRDPICPEPIAPEALSAMTGALPPPIVPNSPENPAEILQPAVPEGHRPYLLTPRRWAWTIGGAFLVGVALLYAGRPTSNGNVVAVCSIPSAQQLASDLVRAYAAHSGMPAGRFLVTDRSGCDVRFAAEAEIPEAVIARDGIVAIVNPLNPISRLSEKQVRGIFSGSVRDWSQLGGPRGAIVPILPDVSSDEANVIATSIFFGVTLEGSIRRGGSSVDVTRAVSGADRAARGAIGLVAFSQAVAVKVVPFGPGPMPSVVSIRSGRYPYTWTISVEPGSSGSTPAAAGLIAYARSSDGAAIVEKDGLVQVHFATPKTPPP